MKNILCTLLLLNSFLLYSAAERVALEHLQPCSSDIAQRLITIVPGPNFPPHTFGAFTSHAGTLLSVYLVAHENPKLRDGVIHAIEQQPHPQTINLADLVRAHSQDATLVEKPMVLGAFTFTQETYAGTLQTLYSMQYCMSTITKKSGLTHDDSRCYYFELGDNNPEWQTAPKSYRVASIKNNFNSLITMQQKGMSLASLETSTWYVDFKNKRETAIAINAAVITEVLKSLPATPARIIAPLPIKEPSIGEDDDEQARLLK